MQHLKSNATLKGGKTESCKQVRETGILISMTGVERKIGNTILKVLFGKK